jgi:transposase
MLDAEDREMDITLDFKTGSRFPCPICGTVSPVHDTKQRRWRCLDFFQHKAFLNAPVPRIKCGTCGVKLIDVPWAPLGGRFTLLFMGRVLEFARNMPIAAVARMAREHDTRIWRIIHRLVEWAREDQDMSQVKDIGLDETANKRGHDYVTVFADMAQRRVLYVAEGRSASTVTEFRVDLTAHNGKPEQVDLVSMDMSAPFRSGVAAEFPGADIVFDRFHVTALVNDALDEIRRKEVKENDVLKRTRYIWLKNPKNLTSKQAETLEMLSKMNIGTALAYQMKLNLQELWQQPDRESAEGHLNAWYTWVMKSDIAPCMKKVANTIKGFASGILNYYAKGLTNGLLEGINSLIQAAKSKARGYRNVQYMKTIIYLVAGKLEFSLPT